MAHCVKCGLGIKENNNDAVTIDSVNLVALATLIKQVAMM